MKLKTLLYCFVCTVFTVLQAQDSNPLFFSEYAEGSGNHKYLEIYNASSESVSLADYALARASNGSDGTYETWSDVFPDDASIAPVYVYVVAHSSADAVIAAVTDVTFNSLSNGDDGFALVMGTPDNHVYVDWIGDFEADPGSGWSVCGESNATKDRTLVRNCDVTVGADWSVSSSEESCQWTVLPKDTWTEVGVHDVCGGVDPCA